jgi:hypothetical protein
MHAIKAIYDGKEFKTLEPIPVKGKYIVAITFIEPADDGQHDLLKYSNFFSDDDVKSVEKIMEERKDIEGLNIQKWI